MSLAQIATENTQNAASPDEVALSIRSLNAWYGSFMAVRDVSMEVPRNQITGLIGPSGSGKSTLLRCLNRIHETVPGARVSGKVMVDDLDIYAEREVGAVRRAIGMVFQRPYPLVTKSIFDNVAIGLTIAGKPKPAELQGLVES